MAMPILRLVRLTFDSFRNNAASSLLSAFGTAVGIASLAFFVALGMGVRGAVLMRLFPTDAASIEVVPSAMSLSAAFGGGRLDESAAERLSAIPGVAEVHRKMEVRVPAMAMPTPELAERFRVPQNIRVALIAVGVEENFVRSASRPSGSFSVPSDSSATAAQEKDGAISLPFDTIPAMASDRLLALYNQAFAKSQGLPAVSPSLLSAAEGAPLMAVQLGRSMAGGRRMADSFVRLTFAGLSPKSPLHGVLIPMEAARAINRAYGQDSETYSSIALTAGSADEIPAIRKAVSKMGFSIDDTGREAAEKVGLLIALTTAAMALLSGLICVIAAINIAHALLSQARTREKEFALMRAVGASRLDIARLVLSEASLVGLLGGIAGLTTARLSALLLERALFERIPELSAAVPEGIFDFSPALLFLSLAVSMVFALLGAIAPALLASRASPARVLAG